MGRSQLRAPRRRLGFSAARLSCAAWTVALWLGAGASAGAATGKGIPFWEWNHPWSAWKILGCLFTVWVCWEGVYHLVFKPAIDARRPATTPAPWPLDAYALAMAAFFAMSVLAFLAWFRAALLVRFKVMPPGPLAGLNDYMVWIALLLVSLLGSLLIYRWLKHPHQAAPGHRP